jgi:hypothetical protein
MEMEGEREAVISEVYVSIGKFHSMMSRARSFFSESLQLFLSIGKLRFFLA